MGCRKLFLGCAVAAVCLSTSHLIWAVELWTPKRVNDWYEKQPWLVGCNFIPSTAINQLEMWQPETFDPTTIDRELGWAESLGFNTVRVFLHDLPWMDNQEKFFANVDKFLEI